MVTLLQRQFMLLSLGTALLFMLTSFLTLNGGRFTHSLPSFQLATSHVSSIVFLRALGSEIPHLGHSFHMGRPWAEEAFPSMLFELIAGISPHDLRTLLGQEIPGLRPFATLQLEGKHPPSPVEWSAESPPPASIEVISPAVEADAPVSQPVPGSQAETKTVFIYHTHNRESWLNVAKRVGQSVDHPHINITLVGQRLSQLLEEKGIGTVVNTEDFAQRLLDQKKSYALSYAESLKAVTAAKQDHRELKYFFDLHRDSSPREDTTVTINGKEYARIYFVIGKRNENYRQNAMFADQLVAKLEAKYPGLTRGVFDKDKGEGNNGEYNQHVSPGSLLIEIGGIENTLEECYRTIEAFAEVFAEYYWQAEPVDTDANEGTRPQPEGES